VSNTTRSKADYIDQHISSRTRSKMNNINNLSVQNLFFPLHNAILFQGYGKSQAQDLQLGVLECKVYHNDLMNLRLILIVCFHYICQIRLKSTMMCLGNVVRLFSIASKIYWHMHKNC
jgi:hypothetical protein